jgi:hypothetical protein
MININDDDFKNIIKNLEKNENVELTCECGSKFQEKSTQYDLSQNSYILLRVNNFNYYINNNNNNTNQKKKLKNFSSNSILFFGFNYKAVTMVNHSGNYNHGGHYTCMRNMDYFWIQISDQTFITTDDPAENDLRDIYYIIFEKI